MVVISRIVIKKGANMSRIGANEAVERDEKDPKNWRTVTCIYCGEKYRKYINGCYDGNICPNCKEKMNHDIEKED